MEGGDNNQRSIQEIYDRVDRQFKLFIEFDPRVEREDTCAGMKTILTDLKWILDNHNASTVQQRIDNYHLTYNAIIYTLDVCRLLRKSEYRFPAELYRIYVS
jgi:hypothetical protein